MNEISKIISDDSDAEDMEILLSDKKAVFNIGNTEVSLRLMEGEFIRYRDIIPSDGSTTVIIGKSILLESIERASLLAREGKNNLIKISVHNDLMTITSRSEEGNVKEEIIMDKTGDDIDIGFNSKYVTDVLKAIDDEEISDDLQHRNFSVRHQACGQRRLRISRTAGKDTEDLIYRELRMQEHVHREYRT